MCDIENINFTPTVNLEKDIVIWVNESTPGPSKPKRWIPPAPFCFLSSISIWFKKINCWYFVYIWYTWSACFCQNKFSTVYVHDFTFIQLDQREVKKESTLKVNKIKKDISNGKSSEGKSLKKDEVNPMVETIKCQKPFLRSKRKKFMDQQPVKAQGKEWNRMSAAQMSQLMKKKIF